MIRLDRKRKRLVWERADIVPMSRILGSDDAGKMWAPPVSSILRMAVRKSIPLHPDAQAEYGIAELYNAECARLQKLTDAEIHSKHAARYFPHQRADIHYIEKLNLSAYLLAHEVGVGKTPVAIRFGEFREAQRIAVITMGTAKDQWRDEIVRWRERKMPIRIVEGSVKEQIHTITTMKTGWCIGHWESLQHARDGWIDAAWDLVIVDELHMIQNRNTQRAATLFDIDAAARMALGAHPFSNSIHELYTVLKFLYPERYPSFWRWANMHVRIEPKPFGGLDMREPRRPKLLQWEIRPFTMRRAKRDVWKNLPPATRLRRVVELSPKARTEYQKLQKQFFVELEKHAGEKRILAIPSVLARITRLRQYLIDPGILEAKEPSVKYVECLSLIDEIQKPVVIFTAFREAAERLQKYLHTHKKKTEIIVGGMRKRVRPIKKKFLRGEIDAVIIMIKVGGTALNFGKYGYYIDLDMPWNPRDFEQTEGRVDRPEEGTGKMVAVTGFRIIVKDSYEERMEALVQGKHGDFTSVFTVNTLKKLFSDDGGYDGDDN